MRHFHVELVYNFSIILYCKLKIPLRKLKSYKISGLLGFNVFEFDAKKVTT